MKSADNLFDKHRKGGMTLVMVGLSPNTLGET